MILQQSFLLEGTISTANWIVLKAKMWSPFNIFYINSFYSIILFGLCHVPNTSTERFLNHFPHSQWFIFPGNVLSVSFHYKRNYQLFNQQFSVSLETNWSDFFSIKNQGKPHVLWKQIYLNYFLKRKKCQSPTLIILYRNLSKNTIETSHI